MHSLKFSKSVIEHLTVDSTEIFFKPQYSIHTIEYFPNYTDTFIFYIDF